MITKVASPLVKALSIAPRTSLGGDTSTGASPSESRSSIGLVDFSESTRYDVSFSRLTTALRVSDERDRRLMSMEVAVSGERIFVVLAVEEEEEGDGEDTAASAGGGRTRGDERRRNEASNAAVAAAGEEEGRRPG